MDRGHIVGQSSVNGVIIDLNITAKDAAACMRTRARVTEALPHRRCQRLCSDLSLSIPDIIQHHYDCIIQAEHEVFLATNFWQASKSATKICDAFIELSKRAEKRGKKVTVKVMYDRANLKMIAESHLYVDEAEWTSDAVKMPKREEMPWVDFQLVNYHQCVHLCIIIISAINRCIQTGAWNIPLQVHGRRP